MSTTKIEWTATRLPDGKVLPGYTFNPWIGCWKISRACENCYAAVDTFARVQRKEGNELWGRTSNRHVTGSDNWKKPMRWNRQAERSGIRRKVFCASLSDVFEQHADANTNELLNQTRSDLWSLIIKTPYIDWLLLTKRPENIMAMVPSDWAADWPANVWVGTTVEDQAAADQRIPELLKVPSRVRFLSVEPMMGAIDITQYMHESICNEYGRCGYCDPQQDEVLEQRIDWVIAGGESGPKAQPSHPQWFRSLRDQCVEAGVKYFFKQWGEWVPFEETSQNPFWRDCTTGKEYDAHGLNFLNPEDPMEPGKFNGKAWADPMDIITEFGEGVAFLKVGKKAAGRLLDGKEWNEMPE